MGETEHALQSMERAYQDGSDCMSCIDGDPQLDALETEPRFQDLLRRMRSD